MFSIITERVKCFNRKNFNLQYCKQKSIKILIYPYYWLSETISVIFFLLQGSFKSSLQNLWFIVRNNNFTNVFLNAL